MEEILLKLNRVKTGIEQKIDSLATGAIANLDSAFASWRAPWTADRAEKLDRLDADVSSRASEVSQGAISETVNTIAREMTLSKRKGLSQEFSAPGAHTFSVPSDTAVLYVTAIGGGGGGGGGAGGNQPTSSGSYCSGTGGGGGGGGGKVESVMSVTPGEQINVIVGAGGTGGARGPYKVGAGNDPGLPSGNRGNPGASGGASSVGDVFAGGGTGDAGGGGNYQYKSPGLGGDGGLPNGNRGDTGGVPTSWNAPGGSGGAGGGGMYSNNSIYGGGGNGGRGSDAVSSASMNNTAGSNGSGGYVLIEW